jgi:hypothetical protein
MPVPVTRSPGTNLAASVTDVRLMMVELRVVTAPALVADTGVSNVLPVKRSPLIVSPNPDPSLTPSYTPVAENEHLRKILLRNVLLDRACPEASYRLTPCPAEYSIRLPSKMQPVQAP